jgi:hypothetical protein
MAVELFQLILLCEDGNEILDLRGTLQRSRFAMVDVPSVVPPKTCRHYSHYSIHLEPMYDALTHKMKRGAIKELSKLEGWRLKLSGPRGDPNWRPYISESIRRRRNNQVSASEDSSGSTERDWRRRDHEGMEPSNEGLISEVH